MLDIPKGDYSKCVDSLDNLGKHSSVPLSKHGFRFHSSEVLDYVCLYFVEEVSFIVCLMFFMA